MLITKDGITLNVSKGAFDASFRTQGWVKGEGTHEEVKNTPIQMAPQPVKESKPVEESDLSLDKAEDAKNDDLSHEGESVNNLVSDEEKDAENSEKVDENAIETPISEMTVNELIDFADEHNIDISGLQGKAKIRAAIEASLNK